jgi:hypothetical protein
MPKIDQFLQYAKQALAPRSARWNARCAASYIIDFGQCHLAVTAANVVQSEPVSRLRSRRYGKGLDNDH